MRRSVVLAGSFAAALALAGCSQTQAPAQPSAPVVNATPPPLPPDPALGPHATQGQGQPAQQPRR